MSRSVTIGVVGHGVVGAGLLSLLSDNLPVLESKIGTRLRVGWVASRRKRPLPVIGGVRPRWTDDWREVVSDPAVDIVVELIGGVEPARTLILTALKAGQPHQTSLRYFERHHELHFDPHERRRAPFSGGPPGRPGRGVRRGEPGV